MKSLSGRWRRGGGGGEHEGRAFLPKMPRHIICHRSVHRGNTLTRRPTMDRGPRGCHAAAFHPVLSSRKRGAMRRPSSIAVALPPSSGLDQPKEGILSPPLSLARQSRVVYKSRWISLVRSGGFQGGRTTAASWGTRARGTLCLRDGAELGKEVLMDTNQIKYLSQFQELCHFFYCLEREEGNNSGDPFCRSLSV